jgi:hypothetical protein
MAFIYQESMLTSPKLNQNTPTSVTNKLLDHAISSPARTTAETRVVAIAFLLRK